MARSLFHEYRLRAIENELRGFSKNETDEYTEDEVDELVIIANMISKIRIPIIIVEHK